MTFKSIYDDSKSSNEPIGPNEESFIDTKNQDDQKNDFI